MVTGQLPLLLVGSIALLALLIGLWQGQISRKLGRELGELRRQLVETEVMQEHKPSFSTSLDRVEREQKTVEVPRSSAEKYRYVAALANQGVDAKEIAAALQMAPLEVEQLLQLAQLKQRVES
ncbi:MAG: hypothetical protein U9Q61_04805 [Thermodesulfobacteriota bacterium]|nr:hypothetical protein [Thermodesulfobacteriota bacterium]